MTSVAELVVLTLGTFRGLEVVGVEVPVPGYLLRLQDGRYVLVDTGWPREMVGDPEASFVVSEADHVLGQLASSA